MFSLFFHILREVHNVDKCRFELLFFDDLYFLYEVREKKFSKIEEFVCSDVFNFDEIIFFN